MLFGRDPVWVTSPPASDGECNLKGFSNIEQGESTPGVSPIGGSNDVKLLERSIISS